MCRSAKQTLNAGNGLLGGPEAMADFSAVVVVPGSG